MDKKIAIFGDCHFPFHHDKAFNKALEIVQQEQPDIVVQIGDVYDLFSMSRFSKPLDLMTPKEEISQARVLGEALWKRVRKTTNAQCYQILGNHDIRPQRGIIDKYPEIASLIDIKHLWKFDGVTTIHDPRQELIIEGIVFMHGYRSKLGDHAKFNLQSTVCGHTHRGGVVIFPHNNRYIFELNAGYLGDPESAALSYTPQKISQWTHGLGLIDKHGPRFIPI